MNLILLAGLLLVVGGSSTADSTRNLSSVFHPLQANDPYRNISFSHEGKYYAGLQYAHIYETLDINIQVKHFNEMAAGLISSEKRLRKHLTMRLGNITNKDVAENYFNNTFGNLFDKLLDAKDQIDFCCEISQCPEVVLDVKKERAKRQLEEVVGIASVGLSIYNLAETQLLKSRLTAVEDNQQLLAAKLNGMQREITVIEHHVAIVETAFNELKGWLSRVDFEATTTKLEMLIDNAATRITQWLQAVAEILVHKRLNPRFFSPENIKPALQQLKASAQRHGFHLSPRYFSDLVREEVSFIAEGGKIFFALHLPDGRLPAFDLYRYIPLPLLLPNKKLVKLTTDNQLVAFNTQLTERAELTEHSLGQCIHRRGEYFCGNNLVSINMDDSCLGALFLGRVQKLRQKCKVERLPESHEFVILTGHGDAMVYAPASSQAAFYLHCPKSQPQQTTLTGYVRIHVPDGCSVTTGHHIIRAPSAFQFRAEIIPRKMSGFNVTLLDQLVDVSDNVTDVEVLLRNEKAEKDLVLKPANHDFFTAAVVTAILVAVIVLAAAMTYIACKVKKGVKAKKENIEL